MTLQKKPWNPSQEYLQSETKNFRTIPCYAEAAKKPDEAMSYLG